jgi:hypothetical protein
MKPRINPQAILQPAVRTQRLAQHSTQKNRQRIIVPQPRHIDRNLQPFIPALALARRIDILAHVDILALALEQPRLSALLDFCFDAHDGLGAVGETHARAAVCGGQDVGLGDERAELRWRAAVGPDWRRGGEGGLQVGELGGREGDVGVWRHGLVGFAGFCAGLCRMAFTTLGWPVAENCDGSSLVSVGQWVGVSRYGLFLGCLVDRR